MVSPIEQWQLHFDGCGYALSARRLWEHAELGQINPFPPITITNADQPQVYVDIADISGPFEKLLGITLADAFAGRRGDLSEAVGHDFLRHVEGAKARRWLSGVKELLQQIRRKRALRNLPGSFLPKSTASPLGVSGLHCPLLIWLKAHGGDKASVAQWYGRLTNLSSKGLHDEEFLFSGFIERFMDDEDLVIAGDAISSVLSYDALRLSVLPVFRPAARQLQFDKVPANTAIKRIKPKLKRKMLTHPQWRDRVLGYWIDAVDWEDLLGPQRGWMAFTYRGQPIVSPRRPSGLCRTYSEAQALAKVHAEKVFPKMSAQGNWPEFRITGGEQYREWLVTLPNYLESFYTNHFEHRNVLMHVRCDMRESSDGGRVLVLHEVQSDWAQAARRDRADDAGQIPEPPWLQEWPALALKLMLLHAAHRGATALVWTPGRVQVERYRGLGAAGLLKLYDRTLPAEANRMLRAYSRKCETIEVFQPVNFYIEPADIGYNVLDEQGELLGEAETWEEAQAMLPDGAHEEQRPMHGIRLDADLRERLLSTGFFAWGGGIR